ncbi:LacI family DNA-binding transcriptional regulator [Streptomyces millisiae]|uniref:LacI family DNA-binding transcriptional regulator n=1 Tax=Streptomyces millisiae TaxID=3075542 RepID=A0ABU2LWN4_9ACTN|nr:LacI family DNA-binding transcriptional regulator [Streptomyces sp. DSM 44918]MDT0321950.1 LacI family DNA-binding transcriptional regulator [Streptomyces sp. DSM 44918]
MTTDVGDARARRGGRKPGRLPTMQDIADHVGVSRQLVSLVMRDVPGPSAESKERILAAASELGYRPNASARLLRQNRTRLIGAVFEMRNPFQVRFVERLFVRAAERGFGVALGPTTVERPTDVVVSQLMEERVEALVAFNPDPTSNALAAACDLVPVVWLGEWVRTPEVDNVHVDEVEGLHLAIEHLVGLGHRDIVYVGGLGGNVGRDRADAYRAAMAEFDLADRIEVLSSDFSEEGGAGAARQLLGRGERPTAVVCCGDQCAVGVLAVFARADVRVPEEISVIGFDDSYLASLSYHRLTSVRQDVEATVEATLTSALERIERDERPRRVTATRTELVVRESTGSVRTGP